MKILFDHQAFEMQDKGGISRLFFEVIKFGIKKDVVHANIGIKYSNNFYLQNSQLFKTPSSSIKKINPILFEFNSGIGRIFKKTFRCFFDFVYYFPINQANKKNKLFSIKKIIEGDFDVFVPTFYDAYFLPYLNQKPYILFIFDMIHELYPELFSLNNAIIAQKRDLLLGAAHIIAISQNTKNDIIKFYNIPENRISVIHLGSELFSDTYTGEEPVLQKIPDKYFLFVGNREAHKNFYFFLEVIQEILHENLSLTIVCAGGPKFTEDEILFFEKINVKNKIVHLFVDDNLLSYLYTHAIALIYPSYYEGFGIPIIEAMNLGCPVIASNAASIPEIGQDAIAYINPKDPASIRKIVRETLNNPEFRSHIIEKGFLCVKKYSWEKTAQEVYNTCRKVLKTDNETHT